MKEEIENNPNWFQRIISAKRKFFLKDKLEGTDAIYNRKFQKIGEWEFSKNSLHNKQLLMNKMTEDGKELHQIGISDGSKGIDPKAMKRISENIAGLWQSFIKNSFEHKLIIAKGKCANVQSQYDNLEGIQKSLIEHKAEIDKDYKYNSKKYSLLLGIIYIVIACLLLYADFPLSVAVVKEGFNVGDGGYWVAIGIVLMTVYFKVIYDEYMGKSIQKVLLSSRPENLLGEGNIATIAEQKKAKRIRIVEFLVKLSILTLLIATLLSLSVFRSNYLEIATSLEEGNIFRELIRSWGGKLSFIFISLVFPIIGGVCASIGFTTIQNIVDRSRIKRKLNSIQFKKERVLKKLLITNGHAEESQNNLDWVGDKGHFLKECAAYFFSCYLHGYDKGIRQDIPEDFFDAVTHLRQKIATMNASDLLTQSVAKNNNGGGLYDHFFPTAN